MTAPHRSQCLFCRSRKCVMHICSFEYSYDEIACNDHVIELQRHADWKLPPGAKRASTVGMWMKTSAASPRAETLRGWLSALNAEWSPGGAA